MIDTTYIRIKELRNELHLDEGKEKTKNIISQQNQKTLKAAYLLRFSRFFIHEPPGTRTPDNLIKNQGV